MRAPRAVNSAITHAPVRFTVFLTALLAVAFAILMPPFQFNDEHGHFVRAYQISRGQFVAREGETLPPGVLALVRGFPEGTDHRFSWREIFEAMKAVAVDSGDSAVPSDGPGQRYFMWAVRASRLYPPIVYLPASTGIIIARALGFSPLGMLYAARSMNVMCFVIAVWLMLSMVPDCRSLIAAVALTQTPLHQSPAVSAHHVTIALSLGEI